MGRLGWVLDLIELWLWVCFFEFFSLCCMYVCAINIIYIITTS